MQGSAEGHRRASEAGGKRGGCKNTRGREGEQKQGEGGEGNERRGITEVTGAVNINSSISISVSISEFEEWAGNSRCFFLVMTRGSVVHTDVVGPSEDYHQSEEYEEGEDWRVLQQPPLALHPMPIPASTSNATSTASSTSHVSTPTVRSGKNRRRRADPDARCRRRPESLVAGT